MTFNWKEYLELAKYLQGKIEVCYSEESARRAAVSRAYYAAFCFARNYAQDHCGRSKGKGPKEHADLIRFYTILGTTRQNFADIAENLDELRQWRNFCDYDDNIMRNLNDLAADALDDAQEIIDILT
ncbi:MAG: HEPN domain-containing protein [Methanothrix sp.]|nr:HEPN domain-containing protein [Methanothrix sp.]